MLMTSEMIAPYLMLKLSTKFAGRKDADRFKINSTTGEPSFDFSSGFFLNFENPVDHNEDGIFKAEIAIKLVGTEPLIQNQPE